MLVVSVTSLLFLLLTSQARDRSLQLRLSSSLIFVTMTVWSVGRVLAVNADNISFALLSVRFSYLGSVWMAFIFLWFVYVFLREKPNYPLLAIVGLSSILLAPTIFTDYFISGMSPILCFNFYESSFGVCFQL
ncbi:MAG: histidine kinase N-terminal 7TM domain-containing protein, partial [Candidatus Margulisiibacteriota bacterium]